MAHKRMAISLPAELLQDIDFVCLKAGVNRSALICELLKPKISELVAVFDDGTPVEDYVESMRRQRRRGDTSSDSVRARMRLINQFLDPGASFDDSTH